MSIEASRHSNKVYSVQTRRQELDGPLDPVKMQRVADDFLKIEKCEKFRVSFYQCPYFYLQNEQLKNQVKVMKEKREVKMEAAKNNQRVLGNDFKEKFSNLKEKDEYRDKLVQDRK